MVSFELDPHGMVAVLLQTEACELRRHVMQICVSPFTVKDLEDHVHRHLQFVQVLRLITSHVNSIQTGIREKYCYVDAGTQTHDERVHVA